MSDPPSIEQLAGFEPEPERAPGELPARVRHYMGEADPPPRRPDPSLPDVSGLRRELGL